MTVIHYRDHDGPIVDRRIVRCDACDGEIAPGQPFEHKEYEAYGHVIEHDFHKRCPQRRLRLIKGGEAADA